MTAALMTTAMGLRTAIPAVVGYNLFTQHKERMEQRYVLFQDQRLHVWHTRPPVREYVNLNGD